MANERVYKLFMDLYSIALLFRKAIETAIEAGDITYSNMLRFPEGCCGFTSDLLQRYLYENGIITFYVSGSYGYAWDNSESHTWLETENKTVIDITGDQYRNKKLRFTEPVYVGTRNNGFHDQFNLDDPVPYQKWEPYGIGKKKEEMYYAILRHLE